VAESAFAAGAAAASDRKSGWVGVAVGLGGLRQLLEDDVVAEAFELGDESFGDAFGIAFAEVVATEVSVELAG
jgi:hypothetical protein